MRVDVPVPPTAELDFVEILQDVLWGVEEGTGTSRGTPDRSGSPSPRRNRGSREVRSYSSALASNTNRLSENHTALSMVWANSAMELTHSTIGRCEGTSKKGGGKWDSVCHGNRWEQRALPSCPTARGPTKDTPRTAPSLGGVAGISGRVEQAPQQLLRNSSPPPPPTPTQSEPAGWVCSYRTFPLPDRI